MKGEGDADLFYPKVAAQHYPYLYRECINIRDMHRHNANPKMVKILIQVMNKYSDGDIDAVSDYMSRLEPVQGAK
jgi:cytochrome c553